MTNNQGWHEDFGDEPSVEERYPADHDLEEMLAREDRSYEGDTRQFIIMSRQWDKTEGTDVDRAIGQHEADYMVGEHSKALGKQYNVWAELVDEKS